VGQARWVPNQLSTRSQVGAAAAASKRGPVSVKNAWPTPGTVTIPRVGPAAVAAETEPEQVEGDLGGQVPTECHGVTVTTGMSSLRP